MIALVVRMKPQKSEAAIGPLTAEHCSALHTQIIGIDDCADEIEVLHDWRTFDADSSRIWPFNPKTSLWRNRTTQFLRFASGNFNSANVITIHSPQGREPIPSFHKLYYDNAFNDCGFRVANVHQKIFDRFSYLINVSEDQSRSVSRNELSACKVYASANEACLAVPDPSQHNSKCGNYERRNSGQIVWIADPIPNSPESYPSHPSLLVSLGAIGGTIFRNIHGLATDLARRVMANLDIRNRDVGKCESERWP